MEIWKQIENYPDYQISNLGRVKSLKRGGEKILKPYIIKGYYRVCLINEKQKTHLLHRLIAIAFIPNPENKPQINHIDGNKSNNLVSNLEWSTASENVKHSYDAGLHKPVICRGEKNGSFKHEIYSFFHPEMGVVNCTYYELRNRYNLNKGNLSMLVSGKKDCVKGWRILV